MSQLGQLKQTIEDIGREAKSTGSNLSAFNSKFSQQVNTVQQTIGGSAQRKDQEVIQTIQAARAKVGEAVQALEAAAQTAQNYGRSL
ncbi:hypothetical protein C6V83_16725 [Gordonia iterans]|uniref:Uncharacterized protein n=1 Tax=Gordonia iterans TaxID=1004901 RepID=A0A2S0KJ02_9ACTN|nr:hypothetical protein [Gordonia iterans]AVM01657.1 hypothetical protein C6V83_16725 [Gordonia iterans]